MKNGESNFTLKQRAALAIATNMVIDQFEKAVKTQHFYNLKCESVPLKSLCCSIDETGLLIDLRNYFSHAVHDEIGPLSPELKQFYQSLFKTVKEQLLSQNAQSVAGNNSISKPKQIAIDYLSGDKLNSFKFEGDVTALPQYEIAFMLAPFMNRSQVEQLTSRIFFGKDATIKDGEKRIETPQTTTIKEMIKKLAQPDRIIIRATEDGSRQWLKPRYEWAYSVLNYLKDHYPLDGDIPLDDKYYFEQLIRFVIINNILPCQFERIETDYIEESGQKKLEQKRVFSDDENLPLRMKFNTIGVKWLGDDSIKDATLTLSVKALEFIITAYLKIKNTDQIYDVIKKWVSEKKDYPDHKPKTKHQDIETIIRKRCKYLKNRYPFSNPDSVLPHDQIRFICQRISVAWQAVHEKPMSKHEYNELRQKISSFNKEELKTYLTEKVLEKAKIELGRGDDKSLKNVITKDTQKEVYINLAKAYTAYLKGVREGLHKRTDEEKKDIAKRLKCRGLPKENGAKPSLPIGIPPKVLRYHLLDDEKNQGKKTLASIENIGRALKGYSSMPFEYRKPVSDEKKQHKNADKKELQNWFRKQLTLAMAWVEYYKLLSDEKNNSKKIRTSSMTSFENIFDQDVELKIDGHSIIMKNSKLRRSHTQFNEEVIKDLINHYAGKAPKVPMFSANEKDGSISIERAIKNCDRERLILIEAALKYETKWRCENPQKIESYTEEGGYIPFKKILPDGGAGEYRNAALHGRVTDFANCPKPLAEHYEKIKKEKENRSRANKKNH